MKARPSVLKRQKERARLEKRQHKEERRAQRKAEDPQGGGEEPGDPDIDWIVPGPQPKEEEEYDWSKIAPQLVDPKTRES